jgi:hypothetical protein
MNDRPEPAIRQHAVPLLIAAGAVLIRFLILQATHSTTEDFLITLRYAENIAAGRGFVYNPGERVLGTTTPLYTLVLALLSWLGLNAAAWGKALNILADGAACLLLARLLADLGRPRVGWLAALLYATATATISVSIGGMETGLVTLASLTAIRAYLAGRPGTMALALGLLFLLRIDGLLLALVLGMAWGVQRRRTDGLRPLLLAFGLFLAVALPWVVFATSYFGSPLPASAAAKVAVYARGREGFLPNLPDFRHQFAGGAPQLVLFAAFLVGAAYGWRRHPLLRGPLLWLLAYYGAMLLSRVPAFPWYFMPPLPLYYACAALGLAGAAKLLRFGALRPTLQNPALAGLALLLLLRLPATTRAIAEAQRLEDEVRRPLGLWLRENAGPTDRILLEPIGYIGYYSRRPVLDIIGLVSPEVLPSYRKEVPNPLAHIARTHRPEWMVLRAVERDQLAPAGSGGETLLNGEYVLVRPFPGPERPVFFVYRRAAAPPP